MYDAVHVSLVPEYVEAMIMCRTRGGAEKRTRSRRWEGGGRGGGEGALSSTKRQIAMGLDAHELRGPDPDLDSSIAIMHFITLCACNVRKIRKPVLPSIVAASKWACAKTGSRRLGKSTDA